MANTNKEIAKKTAVQPKKERRSLGQFFKEVFGEVKKLTWPTKKELLNYTLTVLGFILVFAAIIYALDLAFGEGLGLLAKIDLNGAAQAAADVVS